MLNPTDDQAPPPSSAAWQLWSALAAIALIAAIASYLQALTVVQAADGHGPVTYFVAALADPTLFAASVNIIDSIRRGQGVPVLALLSIGVAAVVTVGANVEAGHPHEVPPWLVRVWPPVAFLLALESLMSWIRRTRPRHRAATGDPCPHKLAATADEAIVTAYLHGRDCLGAASYRAIGAQFGAHHTKVADLVRAAETPAVADGAPPNADPPRPVAAALNGASHG